MPTETLLDASEIAERLKLSRWVVYDLVRRRVLPRLPHGRAYFNWQHVKLVLAKLTLWELQHDSPREVGDEILTAEQIAGELGFTVPKLRALARRRFIPSIRIGGAIRYCLASVRYALDNLISVRECAKRLGFSRWVLDSMSGPGRTLPFLRLNKRCLRYHWPSVQAAIARASARATVVAT